MPNSIENIKMTETNSYIDAAMNKGEEHEITLALLRVLASTREKWEKKEEQQITLRQVWGYGLLFIFSLQILVLLYLVYFSITKNIEVGSTFNIYVTGVFIESLVLPKQIAEHLFPKTETNDLLELFNSIKNKNTEK